MSLDDEVALDLGCKRCARVYLAIFRRHGTSWLNQIVRDTGMTRKSVKRHLKRLLFLRLVSHEAGCVYRIAKEIINNKHYHYNVIPIGMIEKIRILKKNALAPKVKRVFKKFAVKTMPRLRRKDGWCYGNRKKVVKDHVEKLD